MAKDMACWKVSKKRIAGIAEGIAGERGEGQFLDPVQLTPNGRFDQQDGIASREKDCLVGGVQIGNSLSRGAPVRAVQVVDRHP
jgi:hypothetical protein